MAEKKIERPADDDYYVEPWSDQFLQGDLFVDVPFALPAPPDAIVADDEGARFITGPFEAGPAMLISPSCSIAAQGDAAPHRLYGHPARTLIPLRPVPELLEGGFVTEQNLPLLRSDRLVNYIYMPASEHFDESAGLLYMPMTVHHDVIAEGRIAQLTGAAFWHLRMKLMAYSGRFFIHPEEFGPVPDPHDRDS